MKARKCELCASWGMMVILSRHHKTPMALVDGVGIGKPLSFSCQTSNNNTIIDLAKVGHSL